MSWNTRVSHDEAINGSQTAVTATPTPNTLHVATALSNQATWRVDRRSKRCSLICLVQSTSTSNRSPSPPMQYNASEPRPCLSVSAVTRAKNRRLHYEINWLRWGLRLVTMRYGQALELSTPCCIQRGWRGTLPVARGRTGDEFKPRQAIHFGFGFSQRGVPTWYP